ncbi:unnamed protein product [Cuscuta epithymum]|uniref:Uncharacterized protein n=1 Tax=Cuscuta epithymum TaxID=186058 RepID=A0AAV0EWA5_9ASTE|nr:unnamed protein product [Cuscuta epithymum]
MSLRRTKDKTLVGLPTKTILTYYLELSEAERGIYEQMKFIGKEIIKNYICEECSMKNYWTTKYVQMCPWFLRNFEISFQQLKLERECDADCSRNRCTELLSKMLMALQDRNGMDSSICIPPPKDVVIR